MSLWPAAVLFDFDGVIVNSEPLHCRAFQETFAAAGIQLTERQYYQDLIGFDDRGAIQHLYTQRGRPLPADQLDDLLRAKEQATAHLIATGQFSPLPGAESFIRAAAARVPLAICSGALRQEIQTMLTALHLRPFFQIIISAEDVTLGKPNPQGYLLAARRLGQAVGRELAPPQCLVIEDAPTVAASARSAGFPVLAVATTYPLEALQDADWAVPSLHPEQVLRAAPRLHTLLNHTME